MPRVGIGRAASGAIVHVVFTCWGVSRQKNATVWRHGGNSVERNLNLVYGLGVKTAEGETGMDSGHTNSEHTLSEHPVRAPIPGTRVGGTHTHTQYPLRPWGKLHRICISLNPHLELARSKAEMPLA